MNVSHWKLADLGAAREASEEALDRWRAELVIAKELEGRGRLVPKDAYFIEAIERCINALIAPAAARTADSSLRQVKPLPAGEWWSRTGSNR